MKRLMIACAALVLLGCPGDGTQTGGGNGTGGEQETLNVNGLDDTTEPGDDDDAGVGPGEPDGLDGVATADDGPELPGGDVGEVTEDGGPVSDDAAVLDVSPEVADDPEIVEDAVLSDAAADGLEDAVEDIGPEVGEDVAEDVGPSGTEDVAEDVTEDVSPPPPPVLPDACRRRAPALLFDRVLAVDDPGLTVVSIADPADQPGQLLTWDAGADPHAPVALHQGLEDANILVALPGEASCLIATYALSGADTWQTSLPAVGCTQPALGDGYVVVVSAPLTGGGRFSVLDAATGTPLDDLDLADQPTSPPVALEALDGILNNGGSHWLVGTGDSIRLVRWSQADGLAELATAEVFDGVVTSLFVIEGALVGATARQATAEPAGLGGHLLRLAIDTEAPEPAVTSLGDPIAAPGPILAPPIAALGCDSIANGGSHWWCPTGLIGAGGDGWLAGWAVDNGELLFQEDTPDTQITGLALGGDGVIYNGGSHWLPDETGGWELRTFDGAALTQQSTLLIQGATESEPCVPSPVVDSGGTLAMQVTVLGGASEIVPLPTGAGGLDPAWSRAGGSNTNGGAASRADQACPGGVAALFERGHNLGDQVIPTRMAQGPDGHVFLAGRRVTVDESLPWMARIDPFGYVVWSQEYPGVGVQGEAPLRGVDARGANLVAHHEMEGGGVAQVKLLRVDPATGLELSSSLHGGDVDRTGRAVRLLPDGAAMLVGEFAISSPPEAIWARTVQPDGSFVEWTYAAPGDSADVDGMALLAGDDGLAIGGTAPDITGVSAFLFVSDLEGNEIFTDILPPPTANHEILAEDVEVGEDGTIWWAGLDYDGDTDTETGWIRRYTPTGTFLGVDQVPYQPMGIGITPGGAWVVGEFFETTRLTASGGVAFTTQHGLSTSLRVAFDALPRADGGFLAGGASLTGEEGENPVLALLVRTDPWGVAGCGAAGVCVTLGEAACDDGDPCTSDVCDPQTGACTNDTLDDGTPCGAGLTCAAGSCQ